MGAHPHVRVSRICGHGRACSVRQEAHVGQACTDTMGMKCCASAGFRGPIGEGTAGPCQK